MKKTETLLRTSTPIARKEHVCAACGNPIAKGEKYLNVVIKQEKKLINRKTHLYCSENKEQAKRVTPLLPITEQQFKQQVHVDTVMMLEKFSFEENMQIAFTPLVITEVAWHYVMKVLDYVAKERISETKKLSRTVKALREKYIGDCRKDLDWEHMAKMKKASEMFVDSFDYDLSILFFSLNNELKKKYPNLIYLDMRTEAGIAIILLHILNEHCKRMDDLMEKKLGHEVRAYRNPINDRLIECMKAYMSPAEFEYKGNVKLSMSIIQKRLNQIEWNVK